MKTAAGVDGAMEHLTGDFRLALILGGARSGKSRLGLALAAGYPAPRLFVATGEAGDAEMAARIQHHRRERGPEWETLEAPVLLAETITGAQGRYGVILVDCLTLWLANLMLKGERSAGGELEAGGDALLEVVRQVRTPTILISNEVGWGIVPDNPLARQFRDRAGWLHQRLAEIADLVVLAVAGLPVTIKGGRTR
jgi:adenosylcobinamide kinase/adenosylcobinamide-phosphate guanylyltransferase